MRFQILAPIGQRRDAPRALTRVRTRGVARAATPCCRVVSGLGRKDHVRLRALNPRGLGTEFPLKKMIFFRTKKSLTKGGESPSALFDGTRGGSRGTRADGASALRLSSTESRWACGPPKIMKMREFIGALESVAWPALSAE